MKQIRQFYNTVGSLFRSDRFRKGFILFVILIQVAVIAFRAGQRTNYYIDELFSFGSAHSYTFDKKDIMYINVSDAWKLEEWVDNADLKKQLEITEKESLLSRSPVEALRMLLTRRNYHGILNILTTVFSRGEVSMAPAIGLNLILFALSQIVLYRITRDLTGSEAAGILALTMYGFSGMAISTALYIRFYMLVTLLLLLLIRLHQRMWQSENLLRCELFTLISLMLLYLAMKDSELVFVVGGALAASYAVGLLIGRQYKKGALYIGTVFPLSLLFVLTRTSFFDVILHPGDYAQENGAVGWMTSRLMTVNRGRLVALFFKFLRWISDLMFGSWYVLCCFVIVVILLLEVRLIGGGKKSTDRKEERPGRGFAWVLAAVCLIYYVFALLTAFPAIRYFMFYFPLLTILLWKMLHELMNGTEYRAAALVCCCVLVCVGALALQFVRPEAIDFIYPEDREVIDAVRDSGIEDAIVIYTGERDSNHACYDCINLMPRTAKLYPIRENYSHIDAGECPDRMLVWIHRDRDPGTYVADLLEAGYSLENLGGTHASDVYTASRSDPSDQDA